MVKNCDSCAGAKDGVDCIDCRAGHTPSKWRPGANYIPPTNADRIRAMSDEELAEFLTYFDRCEICDNNKYRCIERCIGRVLNWLTQPAQEEG